MNSLNQNKLQHTFTDVQQLMNVPTDYLETLTQQYPWFVKAQQLLTKKYQLESNEKFNEQLQHAALLSLDRTKLFELIERTIIQPKVEVIETIAAPIVEEKMVEIKEEIKVQLATYEKPIIEKEVEQNKVAIETVMPDYYTAINEQIFSSEVIETIDITTISTKNKFLEKEIETEKTEMKSSEPTPQSFTSWLKKFSKGSSLNEPKQNKPTPQKPVNAANNDEDDNEVDDLKVNLEALSSFGMQQHEEFVTETMAQIFVEQEKYEKAISTYQKLSLLKPEKSAFFATQISELKNKIA